MQVLPVPFAVLTCFGIWKPIEWTSNWKRNSYNLLSTLVLLLMYTFVGSELAEVLLYLFRYNDISETLFILLTTSSVCYKAVAFIIKKRDLMYLVDMLQEDYCIPKNKDELAIQKKFDDVNRYVTKICLAMVYGNVLSMLAVPFFQTSEQRELPFKTWLPYSIQSQLTYWLSFVHQFLGLLCCASVSVANDTIVTGFMMQACAQLEILEHRFKVLPRLVVKARKQMTDRQVQRREVNILKQHVLHHNHIYEYIANVVDIFNSVIFVQFCASAMVITVSVYQLSMKNPGDFDFIMVLFYLMSMLTEFFMYCWFGNEVTIKSIQFAKNVYTTDWTELTVKSWKIILFVIHRTSRPIVISCYNWIFLSLDTYVQILKLSYSAFNILRRSTVEH